MPTKNKDETDSCFRQEILLEEAIFRRWTMLFVSYLLLHYPATLLTEFDAVLQL